MVASRILCGAYSMKLWIYKGANLTLSSKVERRIYILSEIAVKIRHFPGFGVPVTHFSLKDASAIG